MAMSSILRLISVLVVMLVVGLGWFGIGSWRLKRKGVEQAEASSQASKEAKKYSLIAAFLYMVAMVSVAGLFM